MGDKRYLIYWDSYKGITGNSIFTFNPKELIIEDLIKQILKQIHSKKEGKFVENVTIKFMMELK